MPHAPARLQEPGNPGTPVSAPMLAIVAGTKHILGVFESRPDGGVAVRTPGR